MSQIGNDSPCYFCNEMFEKGKLQNHLKQCGSILEQCPLRCGAWIQRKHRDTHVKECPQMEKTRNGSSPTHARISDPVPPQDHVWTPKSVPLEECVSFLEKEVASIKMLLRLSWLQTSANISEALQRHDNLKDGFHALMRKQAHSLLHRQRNSNNGILKVIAHRPDYCPQNMGLSLKEESSFRNVQSTEFENLRSELVLVEDRSQHFLSTIISLRAAIDDEAERSANWAAQFKHDLANVQLALQELQSQQLTTVMRLESAVTSLLQEQRERELLEQALTHHGSRIRAINKLEEVIEYIKQTVEEERERNAESRAILDAEVVESRRSSEQLAQLLVLRQQIQSATSERPAIDRLAVLEVTTATARAESAEQATRMELVSRDLRALSKSYHKLKRELVDFQTRITLDNNEFGGDNGHLIWRIDNFSNRMKQAKESDAVICSPLFRTSKYGYTLKAELQLNGIGKWKGRHLTCTVRTVSGPYDALLQWPCDLTLNVILKDQPANRTQAMDIVKSLELRRKSSTSRHESEETGDEKTKSTETLDRGMLQIKRQYIFIPHTSLDKFEYVKNDVMFIEFIVVD